MAVENKFKHSKDLFQNADGSDMVFFMRPCNQRQELRPLIEYGGGKVTSKVLKGSTKLAEKGSLVSGDDYIAAHFIEDCVKQNKLLPMASYRVQPGTRVRSHSGDSNNSIRSFSSNDSMSPAGYIVQTSAREWKGRTKYTKEDDIAMITFLMEEKRYSEALGLRVWKDMECHKVTKHSASSMNTRYRKHILPNIESYKYDVDRRWLSKLNGSSGVKEAEPEFSADALFSPSKRSRRPGGTTRKINLTGGFGDVFDFTEGNEKKKRKEVESINEIQNMKEQKENGDKEIEMGNKCVNKEGKKMTEEEEENIPEIQKINQKISNGVKELEIGNKSVNKNSKEIKENNGDSNGEDVAYSKKRKDATNSGDQDEKKSICEKCSKVEKDCEKHVNEEIYRAYAVEVVLDKLTENEINSGKVVDDHSLEKDREKNKLPKERKGKGDGNRAIPRKPNDSVGQTEESAEGKNINHQKSELDTNCDQEKMEYLDTAVPSPSDIFQMTDEDGVEFEENDTVKNGKNKESQMVVEIDDGRLTLSQESGDSELSDIEIEPDVQNMLKCGKRKADEVDTAISTTKKRLVDSSDKENENTDTQVGKVSNSSEVRENAETQPPEVIEICSNEVTSSGQCIIENSGESGSVNVSNVDENDSDSFDEMLKSYIKETNIIVVSTADEDSCSVNEIERDEEVTIVNSDTRQSSEERNKKQSFGKRKNEEDCTETVSAREKKRKLVAECRAIIQTIANKYDLCEGFVRQLLFQCSGDVDRTVSYIEYGPHSPGLPPWREMDDNALERNPKTAGLIHKFGLEDVINRYNFINYIT